MELDSQEILVASWVEPTRATLTWTKRHILAAFTVGCVLAVGFVALGFFLRDWTYYIAATGSILASIVIIRQNRSTEQPEEISITNERVVVGSRSVAVSDIVGFFLTQQDDYIQVTFVEKRRVLVPLSCLAESSVPSQVRSIIGQVLPEIEPIASDSLGAELLNRFRR
jgi:uncharacterized membrane protein